MTELPSFEFLLYVADDGPNSILAQANLHAFCRDHLSGRHHIALIDVLKDPQRALTDSIFMTPTLVKLLPKPERRIVGTLSQPGILSAELGLKDPKV